MVYLAALPEGKRVLLPASTALGAALLARACWNPGVDGSASIPSASQGTTVIAVPMTLSPVPVDANVFKGLLGPSGDPQ